MNSIIHDPVCDPFRAEKTLLLPSPTSTIGTNHTLVVSVDRTGSRATKLRLLPNNEMSKFRKPLLSETSQYVPYSPSMRINLGRCGVSGIR